MNKNLNSQIKKVFFKIVAEENDPQKIQELFLDLCGEKKMADLSSRVACALYLDKGRNEEDIMTNLDMKKSDVVEIKKNLGNVGIQYLIQHAKAEEFASEWSTRIIRLIKTIIP